MWVQIALAVTLAASSISAYQYPTHGAVTALDQSCLTDMNNIFNNVYLLTSTAETQDNRTKPWFLTAQRRLGCRLTILEALESPVADGCPPEDQLINCFWVAGSDWSQFVRKCELFQSQVPLPACSDSAGEAAEGIPACTSGNNAILNSASSRKLLQGGPANSAGIATWQYSNGEAAGLQYDPFAPAGSPYAQPPLASNLQGVSGIDAAALGALNEGNEGGTVSGGGAISGSSGCFPSFWTAQDFDNWLNGDLQEGDRPKDYGGVNAVGLTSVLIYTIALCSLAFF